MPEIDFCWSTDDVTKMTDTDLVTTRDVTMYCRNSSRDPHKRALALADHLSDGSTWTDVQSGDHALRIYLAYLIDSQRVRFNEVAARLSRDSTDSREVSITRDDFDVGKDSENPSDHSQTSLRDVFDVAYTIPPTGWVINEFEKYNLDWESTEGAQEQFNITTASVVKEMCSVIVEDEETEFDELSDVIEAALEYCVP